MRPEDYKTIIYEPGPITKIIHNEPDIRNPLTGHFILELRDALERLQRNREAMVGVLLANGPVYCSGHNLGFVSKMQDWKPKEPTRLYEEDWRENMDFMRDYLYMPLWNCTTPLVVGVRGGAFAGGVEFALYGDIVIVTEGAHFDYGTFHITGTGPAFQLIYNMSWKKAMEIYLSAWCFTAEEALEWGLINKVVPEDKLEDEVMLQAERIARMPPEAPRLIKENLKLAMNQMGVREAIFYGNKTDILGHLAKVTEREKEFYTILKQKGMKEAVAYRDKPFEEVGFTTYSKRKKMNKK